MRRGFTLIEIMVFSTIYGVFASVAIPGFVSYIHNSKASEAKVNLHSISLGALSYYEAEHYDGTGLKAFSRVYPNCGSTFNENGHSVTGCKAGQNALGQMASASTIGKKFDPNAYREAMSKNPWNDMHFQIHSPFYYYYDYASNDGGQNASVFSAKASASLSRPCDSIYSISGRSDGISSVIIDLSDDLSACNTATAAF